MIRTKAQRLELQRSREAAQITAWEKVSGEGYKKRRAVRHATRKAIKRGKIKREPCMVCGHPETDPHHFDYSKRFSVQFLCKTHHLAVHGKKSSE